MGKDCSSFRTVGIFAARCWMNFGRHPTGLLPGVSRSTSGAIHPSVPGIPDRKEKLLRPSGIFLQSPKSEMRARTWPRALGPERRMFLGLRSRWTAWQDDGEGKIMFWGWWTVTVGRGEEDETGRILSFFLVVQVKQYWITVCFWHKEFKNPVCA